MSLLNLPFFTQLEQSQSVLVAGAGGGFDIFCGLPLYFALRSTGKKVFLANLSFTLLKAVTGNWLGPGALEVTADSRPSLPYFPEKYLCQWFRQQGEEVPIYCFDRAGVQPLQQSYRAVVAHLQVDTVILVDGGTDSLMRGDEAGLGTPAEDMASIAVVNALDIPAKFLVSLGLGVDAFHGVSNAHSLEAVAELTRLGGFLGAISLLAEMPEVVRYREAVEAVFAAMPNDPSIVSASILSALEGQYGNHHRTTRTRGSSLYINPLMVLYWCFRLETVARRILYLEEIKNTQTTNELLKAIIQFQLQCASVRKRMAIPDASLEKAL